MKLTIGFESNLQTNATRKREKYQDLINKQLNYYEEAKFVNVSISSLGVFSETSLDLIEMFKDLEIDMHCRKYLVRKLSTLALGPHIIYSVNVTKSTSGITQN